MQSINVQDEVCVLGWRPCLGSKVCQAVWGCVSLQIGQYRCSLGTFDLSEAFGGLLSEWDMLSEWIVYAMG